MYLKAIELNGFKSFAKKAGLTFTSPISSIVGPNGSGKSNVAEGFRFVLGEQSIKSMRGKRGEDLIFNGGFDGSRVNRASVKLTFDNAINSTTGSRSLPIDFDEVTIERVVHRDNTNEYFINGSQVRLKDVIELLAAAHIGASGHHIISQGEADRILSASIRERRDMIEDALGLKIYQYKKAESLRKIAKTDENIKSVESLRREVAPHLKFLKKQVEKVEKMEEMRKSLRALYQEYLYREEIYIKNQKNKLAEERKLPEEELKNLAKERKEAEDHLAKNKKNDDVGTEMIKLQHDLDEHRKKREQISHEIGRMEGEINSLTRFINRERERSERDEHRTVLLKDVDTLTREVDSDLAKAIDLVLQPDSSTSIQEILGAIRGKIKSFINSHQEKVNNDAILEANNDIKSLEVEKVAANKMLDQVREEERKLEMKFSELRSKVESDKDTTREFERKIFIIVAKENELRGILASVNAKIESLRLVEHAYENELQEARIIGGREAVDTQLYRSTPNSSTEAEIFAEQRTRQEERRREIEKFKIRLEDSGVTGSADIVKEYKETQDRDMFLAKELEDLVAAKQSLMKLISELDEKLGIEFRDGLHKINVQFQHFFSLMFGGGTAKLDLMKEPQRKKKSDFSLEIDENVNANPSDEPASETGENLREGIDIAVNLPRKKVKGLMMLSGGERALTSIALLFAISQVKPPPFIILDETDAALDEANSRKYGDMIESLSKYSQLILITHNRETMSRAGVLYGVTIGSDGSSRVLSIAFDEAVKIAK